MGRKSKKRDFNRFNSQPKPNRDLRFLTTVKVSPQAAAQHLQKQAVLAAAAVAEASQKLVPRAVRGFQHSPKVPVAQNNVKWSGKKMGKTKFSMFTKKTGLNTIMSNKNGSNRFKIPALMVILAVVLGGGGYWAYSSLGSTEWGRMSSSNETNKWLENVSTQRQNAGPSKDTKSVSRSTTESYKTWGNASSAAPTKKITAKKSASKKHAVKSAAKNQKGKKIVAAKKGKSKKATVAKKSHRSSKDKATLAKAKKTNKHTKNVRRTSGQR